MISLPSAANYDAVTNDANPSPAATDDAAQKEDADDIPDDASTAAQVDGTEEDIPSLVSLDMDRSSVDEVHIGSDAEDSTMVADMSEERSTQELEKDTISSEHLAGPTSSLSEDKPSGQVDSSATTSDGGVDSDAKTLETVATSTSADVPAKYCRLQRPFVYFDCSNVTVFSPCYGRKYRGRSKRKTQEQQKWPEQSRPTGISNSWTAVETRPSARFDRA